jgi:hypothetical protein
MECRCYSMDVARLLDVCRQVDQGDMSGWRCCRIMLNRGLEISFLFGGRVQI